LNESPEISSGTALEERPAEQFDAIVIGAGLAGIAQLHRLRQLGFDVCCLEEAEGVGGTWYWQGYPGCAFDTPSETYGYSFSTKILQEWDWKNLYSLAPDTEEYLNFVVDTLDLRGAIRFGSGVVSATWTEDERVWEVRTENGTTVTGRFFFPAVGVFSTPFTPAYHGIECFRGEQYHTGRWPRERPDFEGKRLAVIGTGASAVQLIPEVAKSCAHLTVFQRTPNYSVPIDNRFVDPAVQREWKATYPEIHRSRREGLITRAKPDPRHGRDVPKDERLALYEEKWTSENGSAKFMTLFHDLFTDRELLEEYSEWLRGKIRERVQDPTVAETLVPKKHLFQAKRTPTESGYYETFNRDNVLLVDINETPIERLTETGIQTSDRDFPFDEIIWATGFDSVTGSLTRIDIRGIGGRTLKDKWSETGLSEYLGLAVAGFPNMFISSVPALITSPPRAELTSEWFQACLSYMNAHGYTRIEATQESEDVWMEHHQEVGDNTIFGEAEDTWYKGKNVPGKKQRYMVYFNDGPAWQRELHAVAEAGYSGFVLS
jgi:cation diffusion facilitator CzcD-associated flavoprotein CzcO